MDLYLDYESPVGHLLLTCDETGLTGIWMNRPPQGGGSPHPTLLQAAQWLDGYFAGKPAPIDFPLAPQGTPFQRLIWDFCFTAFWKTFPKILKKEAYHGRMFLLKNPMTLLIRR